MGHLPTCVNIYTAEDVLCRDEQDAAAILTFTQILSGRNSCSSLFVHIDFTAAEGEF